MKNKKAVLDYLTCLLKDLSERDDYIYNDEEIQGDIVDLLSDICFDIKNTLGETNE